MNIEDIKVGVNVVARSSGHVGTKEGLSFIDRVGDRSRVVKVEGTRVTVRYNHHTGFLYTEFAIGLVASQYDLAEEQDPPEAPYPNENAIRKEAIWS